MKSFVTATAITTILFSLSLNTSANTLENQTNSAINFSSSNQQLQVATPINQIFHDPRLAQEVARQLTVPVTTPVTAEQLQGIREIWVRGANISDLEGIQYLTGLIRLDLSNNNISDLRLIANLTNLNRLYMFNNRISNISPIARLIQLDEVSLSTNGITNISVMRNFSSLDYLDLRDNTIRDISPLSRLPVLRKVELGNNNISDVSSFANSPSSRLEFFSVENTIASHIRNANLNAVSDISSVGYIQNLYARFQRVVLPNGVVNRPTKFILRNRNNVLPGTITFVRGQGVVNDVSVVWQTPGSNELSWSDPSNSWFRGTVVQSVTPSPPRP